MNKFLEKGIFCFFTFFCCSVFGGELSSKMISTGWLRSNIYNQDIRIIDIRNEQSYKAGHIPKASFVSSNSIRQPQNKQIALNSFSNLLGSLGINQNSTVIIYGDEKGLQPFYLLWLFDYIGHKNVALLEGGIEKWINESRPITKDVNPIEATHYQMPKKMTESIKASKNDILKAIQTKSSVIIDVESPDTYAGIQGNLTRKGHIKGAINSYWKNDLQDVYLWKNIDLLKKNYSEAGIETNKKIILVCENCWAASHAYFTLRYIVGLNSLQLYDGGMEEWSKFSECPMEQGTPEIQASSNDFE